MKVNIVFPVLDEERRLEKGISATESFLKKHPEIDAVITIADNGSTDRTLDIIKELAAKYNNIQYISLEQKGFGLAFRTAAKQNECEIIGYVDVDLSTDIKYLTRVMKGFEKHPEIDVIKGNRLSKKSKVNGRKASRNVTSIGLDVLIKLVFGVKVSDTMEGFQFFRKECLDELIAYSGNDNGWFYCAELLIRGEKLGFEIAELPVVWNDDYDTKVDVKKLIVNYLVRIFELKKSLVEEYFIK
jgi:glycosyltransferase involved in cell wall biosynthesis